MRGKIEILTQKHYTNKQIAREIGCHPSTIGRELVRGSVLPGHYSAETSQQLYEFNRTNCRSRRKLNQYPELGSLVKEGLKSGHDPDQIAGRMKLLGMTPRVCRETIYTWIYEDEINQQEALYQYLKFGKKRRGHHYVRQRTIQCFKIPNRVSIHERPSIVEQRARFGDWEGDTVIYPHQHVVVTLYERVSGLVRLAKSEHKSAKLVCTAMGSMLQATLLPQTVTLDNGPEFHWHHLITEQSGATVFFADKYSSWQRGGNEQMNRQLRRYLPRGGLIDDLTKQELQAIENELNNKPRQRLGYRTPNEVYRHIRMHYTEVQTEGVKLDVVAFGVGV
jgi:IS30 family transposase